MARTGAADTLIFIDDSDRQEERSWWRVSTTGNFGFDNELGVMLGQRTAAHLRKHKNQTYLLGWIIRDMVKSGNFNGVEIGFFHALAKAIIGSEGTTP